MEVRCLTNVLNRELKRQFNAHMNRQWQQKTHERLMRKAFSHISESDMHSLLNLASAHFDRRHKRAFNIEFYLIVVKFARMQLDLRANPAGVDPIDLLPKLFNLVATVPPRLRKENSEVREATDEVLRSAAPLVDRSNNSELCINYRASALG